MLAALAAFQELKPFLSSKIARPIPTFLGAVGTLALRVHQSAICAASVPDQPGGVEHRAVHADALVVPAVGRLHLRHATEADARRRRPSAFPATPGTARPTRAASFARACSIGSGPQPTSGPVLPCDSSSCVTNPFVPMLPSSLARCTSTPAARKSSTPAARPPSARRSRATPCPSASRGASPPIAARAEQFAGVREERRLPDAARDERDAVRRADVEERLAERPPHLEAIRPRRPPASRPVILPTTRYTTSIATGLPAVEDGVVEGERPAEERVGGVRQPEHDELPRPDRARRGRGIRAARGTCARRAGRVR